MSPDAELNGPQSRGTSHPAGSTARLLGGSGTRADALDKVTGRARYAGDMATAGFLHIKVLRSASHNSRLRGLDVSRAAQMPGVVRVLTSSDIPGVNGFPDYSCGEPVLASVDDMLPLRGAPIALVIAETQPQAQAAHDAIEMDIEPLPYTFDMDEALKPGVGPIAGHDNELSRFTIQHGNVKAALDGSDHILEAEFTTAYIEHAALEPEALVGYVDEGGRVTVVGGTHQPHNMQRYIAETLGIPQDSVRVIVPPMGGSFGGKQDPWPFVAVGLAVYRVRRALKLAYSRRESFEASPKRHPYRVQYRIGATDAGRLTALHVRIDCNTGGYDGAGRFIPNYALTCAGGAYRWQAVDGMARSIYTNGPKAGQFRGFGTSQSTFALECALDELIQEIGDDPVEFRLRNCIKQEENTFLGYPLGDSLGYPQVLEAIRPHVRTFEQEAGAYNREHPAGPCRRGVGLAGMWYRFGKAGNLKTEAHAELAGDGHFIVYCSAPDYGQGIDTVMSQIAADTFGVQRSRVEVINADTARVPNSDVQGASRATFFVGGAVAKAAGVLIESILEVAAGLLDLPVGHLSFQGDCVSAGKDGRPSISLVEVAREFDRIGRSRRVAGFFDISPAFPEQTRPEYVPLFITGAHAADVLVDLETGVVQVLRMAAAHDVGRAVNPSGAAGQIQGAIVMGLGAALSEEFIPGQTMDLSQYILPMAGSMPEIEVILVEVPSLHGPYGVKGLGEAPLLPSTPAIINAVSRAIGARLRSIPATPERVLAAIQNSRSHHSSHRR